MSKASKHAIIYKCNTGTSIFLCFHLGTVLRGFLLSQEKAKARRERAKARARESRRRSNGLLG